MKKLFKTWSRAHLCSAMRGANFAAPGHHLYQRLTIGRRPFSFPAVPNRAFNATRRSFEGIGRQVHMAHTTSTIDGYISL
ncbi:MAG: hypothetical protein KDE45_00105, partial [Caldilineaceae bacterium]|nr:hypothetical protein [Caldilineaceae bacterium]